MSRFWDLLTGPSSRLEAPETRRRARMLAALLLFLVCAAAVLTLLIPQIVAPAEHRANQTLALTGLAVVAIGLLIYAVSRTRHFESAAWFAVFATLFSVTFSLYATQGTIWQDGAPYYLALATILATLLLPLAAASFVIVLSLGLPLVFHTTIPTFGAVSLSNSITFLAITSALLMITGLVRHYDIEQIRTQAQALTESEKRYRALFEASFEGIALHVDGKIMEVNQAMADLWGAPRDALVSRGLDTLICEGSRTHVMESVDGTHHTTQEAVAKREDGERFPLEFITKPYMYQGRIVKVTGFRDITKRKEAETARLKARELQAANERLVEIDRLKTHILNVTSHELNTPITPLRMQVHLLKKGGFGRLNAKQRNSVEILDRNLARLSHLVKDILDVSKIEAGRLRIEPEEVEVTGIAQNVIKTYQAEAEKRQVSLELAAHGGDWVQADPGRLEQVLVNLVSNALKSTPPRGRITISTLRRDDHVVIEVEDTGIGMTPEQRARLFQPFDSVRDDHRTERGSGLGLYIAKGITEHHGGEIRVDSDGPGKGCRATLRLPRRIPVEQAGEQAVSVPWNPARSIPSQPRHPPSDAPAGRPSGRPGAGL